MQVVGNRRSNRTKMSTCSVIYPLFTLRFQKPEPGPPQDLPPANSKRLTFKVAGTKSEEEVEKERMELDGVS